MAAKRFGDAATSSAAAGGANAHLEQKVVYEVGVVLRGGGVMHEVSKGALGAWGLSVLLPPRVNPGLVLTCASWKTTSPLPGRARCDPET